MFLKTDNDISALFEGCFLSCINLKFHFYPWKVEGIVGFCFTFSSHEKETGQRLALHPVLRLFSEMSPVTHWKCDRMSPRAGLDSS
jgi:hypothetical protein